MRANRLGHQNQECNMARKKKVVKPTLEEKKIIEARLKRKYPQMYELTTTAREKKVLRGVSPSDRKALEKMVGKKLKKIYR